MQLFPGESVNFKKSLGESQVLTDEQINEKYSRGQVRIVTEQARYPLTNIVPMLDSNNYQLSPDFQRRRRWDNKKKSRLIESFIMNVPVPPIFLYEADFSYFEVMDGLQRLSSIYDFYQDKFPLEDLQEWKELNGYTYSTLPELVRRGIDRRYISSIILLQESAKDTVEAQRMKQLVFERINSGGVKLEPQETRNALYDGPLNQVCQKLSRNPYLLLLWGMTEEEDDDDDEEMQQPQEGEPSDQLRQNVIYSKMGDVELVLRFFAFRQIDQYDATALETFLDTFLIAGNSFSPEILTQYEILFNRTIKLASDLFGVSAFHLWRKRSGKWGWYGRPTKVVYDTMMYVFCEMIDKEQQIRDKSSVILQGLPAFYENNYTKFGGRNRNKSDIITRMRLFKEYIELCLR